MENWAIALAIFGFFFAGFVKGTTGLGFSTTCLPFLVLALGMERAMPLVLIPSITSNILVMREVGHFGTAIKRFWPMYLATLPGLVIGLLLLTWIDRQIAASVLGLILVIYAAYAFTSPYLHIKPALERILAMPSGLLTGIINGLTGSQIIPSMPFLLALKLDRNMLLQSINISFTLSSLVMLIGLNRIGFLDWWSLGYSVLSLLPVFIGINIGRRVRARLSTEGFRTAVLAMLIFLGAILMVRPLLG